MLVGIIFSMIYSKSFKNKFLINMDSLKKESPQYSENLVGQNFFFMDLEFKNYPERCFYPLPQGLVLLVRRPRAIRRT